MFWSMSGGNHGQTFRVGSAWGIQFARASSLAPSYSILTGLLHSVKPLLRPPCGGFSWLASLSCAGQHLFSLFAAYALRQGCCQYRFSDKPVKRCRFFVPFLDTWFWDFSLSSATIVSNSFSTRS